MPNDRRRFLVSMACATGAIALRAEGSDSASGSRSTEHTASDAVVIFNDDGNLPYFAPYPMTREHLANYLRMFAGKGIDFVSWDVVVNGVCWYASKVAPGIFEGRSDFPGYDVWHLAANIRHLSEIGANVPRAVAEECHRHGMGMLAACRMQLFVASEETLRQGGGVYYNRFAAAHPEMTLQRVDPKIAGWGVKPGEMMSFSFPEVREYLLAPLRELAEDFDIDGIELNFIRGGPYFELDETEAKTPILTEFVGEVRRILDRAARKRNKTRLLLAARVPDDLGTAKQLGLDVAAWIKRGFLDVVMPSQVHEIDFDAKIEDFAALCKGTTCQLLPTIQPGHQRPHDDPYTLEQLRAVADNWYRRGARGVSTFNYQYRRSPLVNIEEAVGWLKELREPARVAAGERIYPFQQRYWSNQHTAVAALSLQKKDIGVRKSLPFPRAAVLSDPRVQVKLRFMAQQWAPDDLMEIEVDGSVLPQVKPNYFVDREHLGMITGRFTKPHEGESDLWPAYVFEVPLPHLGSYRELGIRLVKRELPTEIQIQKIELVVSSS